MLSCSQKHTKARALDGFADVADSADVARAALLDLDPPLARPATRGDCADGPRPCPWVSCRHHLYLDVNEESGSIKFNHPGVEVAELSDSCALDVAERGDLASLRTIGKLMGVTLERVRQIEIEGQAHMLAAQARLGTGPGPGFYVDAQGKARALDDDSPPQNPHNPQNRGGR